jgi:hypothetical protein
VITRFNSFSANYNAMMHARGFKPQKSVPSSIFYSARKPKVDCKRRKQWITVREESLNYASFKNSVD